MSEVLRIELTYTIFFHLYAAIIFFFFCILNIHPRQRDGWVDMHTGYVRKTNALTPTHARVRALLLRT